MLDGNGVGGVDSILKTRSFLFERALRSLFALAVLSLILAPAVLAQSNPLDPQAKPPQKPEGFNIPEKNRTFTSAELLSEFDAGNEEDYLIGPGDELTVQIWDHEELSGKHIVGPDGRITLPQAGSIQVSGLTRETTANHVKDALSEYYLDIDVTVRVDRYTSHRVMVLGRVTNPGVLSFDTPPSLLEVITRAGALPVGAHGAEKTALVRCAVFRGRDKVVWIDLKGLLGGTNLGLNIRLKRNDIVYLPDSDDQLVYVLGEVKTPGAYRLTPTMSLLDALSQAGGPTKDAATGKLQIVRQGQQLDKEFAFDDLINSKSKLNFSLNEGDILYVPKRGLAKAGYVMERISPLASILLFFSTMRN
jgi:polysaccharide export outer membrane protein